MLKFGEERMKITLILFVCVIFSSKWSLKNAFLTKKGVKNQNFKKSKKVPLDNLEIHVVSKFGPIQMKIAACRCCYIRTTTNNDRHLIPPIGNSTYKTLLDHPPHSTTRPNGLVCLALKGSEYSPFGLVVQN